VELDARTLGSNMLLLRKSAIEAAAGFAERELGELRVAAVRDAAQLEPVAGFGLGLE
jgi:hypothetical protein